MPGTPAIQNAIPMPFFGTTPFAAPGLGIVASAIMLGFGLWWLRRAGKPRRGAPGRASAPAPTRRWTRRRTTRWCASAPSRRRQLRPGRDPPRRARPQRARRSCWPPAAGRRGRGQPVDVAARAAAASTPTSWRSRDGASTSLAAVGGVWSVRGGAGRRHPACWSPPRARGCPRCAPRVDAGANAAVLPVLSVASLVGFGAVVAAMPAFEAVRDWVLGIGGGPLVSLRRRHQHPGGADRLGLGRPDHRARCAGPRPTCRWPPSRASIPACCTASR